VGVTAGSVSTVDFGFDPPTPASISGTVWLDSNSDTAINAGELRAPGVTITLYNNPDGSAALNGDETVAATTTTDGSGFYSFGGLAPGNYLAAATPIDPPIPTGSTLTTARTRSRSTGWGPARRSRTPTSAIRPPPGDDLRRGLQRQRRGRRRGWQRVAGRRGGGPGRRDGHAVPGQRDGVLTGADTLIGTAATGVSGGYSFTELAPGSYFAVETDPAGYTSTTPTRS